MPRCSFLKVLCAIAISLALGLTTEPLLAQRGGHGAVAVAVFHGGGGGFHGGGGYRGFHGGSAYGGGYRGATGFHGVSSRPGLTAAIVAPGFMADAATDGALLAGVVAGAIPDGVAVGAYPAFGWGGWGGWGIGISFNFGFGGSWGPAWYPSYAYNPWWWAPPAAPPCYYYPSPCYAPNGYVPAVPGSYSASKRRTIPDTHQLTTRTLSSRIRSRHVTLAHAASSWQSPRFGRFQTLALKCAMPFAL